MFQIFSESSTFFHDFRTATKHADVGQEFPKWLLTTAPPPTHRFEAVGGAAEGPAKSFNCQLIPYRSKPRGLTVDPELCLRTAFFQKH